MTAHVYPNAHGRGQFTRDEALALWPLAAQVLEYLDRNGPTPVGVIARDLGEQVAEVDRVCWWMTFPDDNGFDRMVWNFTQLLYGDRLFAEVRWVSSSDSASAIALCQRRLQAFSAAFFQAEGAADE